MNSANACVCPELTFPLFQHTLKTKTNIRIPVDFRTYLPICVAAVEASALGKAIIFISIVLVLSHKVFFGLVPGSIAVRTH